MRIRKCICLAVLAVMLVGCMQVAEPPGVPTETQLPVTAMPTETQLPLTAILEAMGLPYITPDYFELLAEDFDAVIYLDDLGQDAITVRLISGRELAGETVTVCSDIGQPAELSMELPTAVAAKYSEGISYPVFLSWQDVDWKALAKDQTAAHRELEKYTQDYSLLAQAWEDRAQYEAWLPIPFSYTLNIPYEALGVDIDAMRQHCLAGEAVETVQIRELRVTVGGMTKTYSLDRLEFRGTYCAGQESYALQPWPLPGSYADGYALLQASVEAKLDLTLEKVTVISTVGAKLQSCEIVIDEQHHGWDGKTPYSISRGTAFELRARLECADFKGKLEGNHTHYILLEYTCQGERFQCCFGGQIMTNPDPYRIYGQKELGKDMESYYRDYYYVVEDPVQKPEDRTEGSP